MNPCTSSSLSPPHISHGAAAHPAATLETHGLQLLEMGSKEQDFDELRDLLQSWDVADLLPHLQDEAINVDELQMIKRHHLSELLRNFRFGTRIRFEHHLERWRRWLNVPLQGVQGQSVGHCTGCRCAEVHIQAQPNVCQPPMVGAENPTELVEKTEDLGRNLPAESLVALGEPREMPMPFQTLPMHPQIQNEILVVKEEKPSVGGAGLGIGGFGNGGGGGGGGGGGEEGVTQDGGVSVMGILQASGSKATSLLERLGQNEPLDAVQRLLLIQLVCSYYEDNQLHLTLQRSHLLEREILHLFPHEQLQYYRTERRGKIYVRFTNMKRNKRLNSSRQELKRRRSDLARSGQIPVTGPYTDQKPNVTFGGIPNSSPERSD